MYVSQRSAPTRQICLLPGFSVIDTEVWCSLLHVQLLLLMIMTVLRVSIPNKWFKVLPVWQMIFPWRERPATECWCLECALPLPYGVMCYFTGAICITFWWTGDSVTLCGVHCYSLSSYGLHDIIYCRIRSTRSCWLDLVVSIAGEFDTSYKCVWPILEMDVVGSDGPPVTAALFLCWTVCTATLKQPDWRGVISQPRSVWNLEVCVHSILINGALFIYTLNMEHIQ